jgi:hypothetical protein
MKLSIPALDFVAKELEAVPDMDDRASAADLQVITQSSAYLVS